MNKETIWIERGEQGGCYTETVNGVYLSYNPNDFIKGLALSSNFLIDTDCVIPETAIVIFETEKLEDTSFLIYEGDWRSELESLFPDVEKLKEHYRKYNEGYFGSDGLLEKDNTN